VLIQAFVRFVVEGLGTPAPIAAPERLVIGALYRYVSNPMYVVILATIVGQALLLGQLGLLLYPAAFWLFAAAFVRWHEEPVLTRRFGAVYEAYRRAVPAWWPRLRPWITHRPQRTRRTVSFREETHSRKPLCTVLHDILLQLEFPASWRFLRAGSLTISSASHKVAGS
jgi:hypothetical protein